MNTDPEKLALHGCMEDLKGGLSGRVGEIFKINDDLIQLLSNAPEVAITKHGVM
ncbi:hypothetical protein [Paenibacillus larvae]|uniref:hypothetical protein n=1 Tax=Paenibacillus larvae TaxID=1464 RepID=UPI00288FB7C6|nr:hypothetical protein [Paenibacillus larvae]MDT2193408.1 hypothetical protein [Paenibacillus larvae]